MLITEKAAADMLRLQSRTLTRWRWEGRGPRYYKVGRAVRYRPEDLETFIAETAVGHD